MTLPEWLRYEANGRTPAENPTDTLARRISQATQKSSANVGRYTLMGSLNPYPGFKMPATGC